MEGVHAAWLPPSAWRALGSRHAVVLGAGTLVDTVVREIAAAAASHGGSVSRGEVTGEAAPGIVFALGDGPGVEGFVIERRDGVTSVRAGRPAGLLYGLFEVVRRGESVFGPDLGPVPHRPVMRRRMLDHWDNVDAHPVMGQVERGYSGGSLCWRDGTLLDLGRLAVYARLLASIGVNAVGVNNVNVRGTAVRLLTDRLDDVVAIAAVYRTYGIRVHLSVNFASPRLLGGLLTADPLDPAVQTWWAGAARRVYEAIPDFGGFVVKADSEGEPGPFAYGRDHADGANMLAAALAPHGGVVHWRAFVYNHRQDWRDRRTDRARAAHDHFAPLDGRFRDNVVLQVKYGPLDFQAREPVSPVIGAVPRTRLAVELQVTQEYTGQQKHACYLGPQWSEILGFPFGGRSVADIAAGGDGLVAVSNVGDDPFWTGHPFAQANLYAFGRLAWDPALAPAAILDEWIDLTFDDASLRGALHDILDGSWHTYERYTAPLGVCFMVRPHYHYGPDVDGYEYSRWGTYHFADRDGIGVDRTRATGTGYTGQYPQPWCDVYESPDTCPDDLLLFFHHVPYGHVLHSGSTVIQHIYDTHFAGALEAAAMRERWRAVPVGGLVTAELHARVGERLDEQVRSAQEWRDQINTYFYRKSGVPDAHGRTIY